VNSNESSGSVKEEEFHDQVVRYWVPVELFS
jgi:hypothetical protein